GGMAKVYRAFDATLEREVAVKLINPELRNDPEFDARFAREARIASQLADPHIVVVHDFGIDANLGPYLVMEFLHGQSLRERLTAKARYVPGNALKERCPDASDELCGMLNACLSPNPNARPATAVEVYLRLQELGKASGILLLPPGAIEKLAASRGNLAGA